MSSSGNKHTAVQERTSPEVREINHLELVVALYQQGRSDSEIADLMGVPVQVVNGLVRVAGVMRTPPKVAELANRRWTARAAIARLDIAALAQRWLQGIEPEELAGEFDVPADLLWDALAAHLSEEVTVGLALIDPFPETHDLTGAAHTSTQELSGRAGGAH
jgi:hypothetical protein